MGLVGRVEDDGLADIFQVVSRSRKSGTLVLKSGQGAAAVIIFAEGKVIQAATNDLRDSLGSLLFVKGLVDEGGLRRALEIQRGPKKGVRLGQVLVEMRILTAEKLAETVRKHIENLVCMLLTWKAGSFSFEAGRPALDEDLEDVMREFLIDDGLNTEYLLMESARLVDEGNRNGPKPAAATGDAARSALPASPPSAPGDRRRPVVVVTEYRPSEATAPPPVAIEVAPQPGDRARPGASPSSGAPPRPSGPPRGERSEPWKGGPSSGSDESRQAREMEMLRATSEEMRAQSSFTGIAALTLRYARNLVFRAAIFRVAGDEITEMGRVGADGDRRVPDMQARPAVLPAKTKALFTDVIWDGVSKVGRLSEGSWDGTLVRPPGGTDPGEYFMVPATCEGKVAAVLCGDNAPSGAPLPAVAGLEILMQQAGLAMEKVLLQDRLRELQKSVPPQPSTGA